MEKIGYSYPVNYTVNLVFHYSLLFLWSMGKGMQHIIDGNSIIVLKKNILHHSLKVKTYMAFESATPHLEV
jgi:hypothetical protein